MIIYRKVYIAAYAAIGIALAGCTKEPPVYITSELPHAPAECVSPSTPEPKLDETRDATVLDAVKDRHKLKVAYRTERNLRASCGKQLKVLLPSQ